LNSLTAISAAPGSTNTARAAQSHKDRLSGAALVVHGPLIATYLLELLRERRPETRIATFSYRGMSPLFDTAPFRVAGRPSGDGRSAEVWAETPQGALVMTARAELTA